MAAGSARAGKAYIELGVRSKLTAGLNAAARRIDAFGARVRRVGTLMAGIGVGATAGLVAASKSFASAGAEIRDLSIRLGIGAETLSRLNYAAAQAGANFQGVAKGIGRLARVTSDAGRGLETYRRTFRDLGIDLDQFQTLSLEEQFLTAGDALSKITDESKRAAIAQELFGRSGLELIPIFENGAESVRAFFDEADRLGVTISDEEAKSAKALDDAYTRVTNTLQRVTAAIGEALAPELTALSNNIAGNIANIRAWLKENSGLIVSAAKGAVLLAGVGAAAYVAGTALSVLGVAAKVAAASFAALAAVKTVVLGVGAAILTLNPITLGLAAIVGTLGVTFATVGFNSSQAIGGIGQRLRALKEDAGVAWQGVVAAIKGGDLATAGKIALTGLKIVFKQILNQISDIWNGVINDLAGALLVLKNAAVEVGTLGFAETNTDAEIAYLQQGEIERQQRNQRELDALRQELRELSSGAVEKGSKPDKDADGDGDAPSVSSDVEKQRREVETMIDEIMNASQTQSNEALSGDSGNAIAEAVGNAATAGFRQAEELRTVSRGTFSSFAAGRINTATDQVQREQLSQLKTIAQNTRNATGQVYTP